MYISVCACVSLYIPWRGVIGAVSQFATMLSV